MACAEDEQPEKAVYRELQEEVGLRVEDVRLIGSTSDWLRYRLPSRYVRRHQQPLCIGQKQRWFLFRINDEDVKFDFAQTTEPEFDSWRWVTYWEPVRAVIYFKRAVYTDALDQLAPLAFPDGRPERPSWWDEITAPAPQCVAKARALVKAPIEGGSLVVRTYSPWRRVIFAVILLFLLALLLYFFYEWGRYDGGYDRLAVAQQRVEREVTVARLEKSNRELRTRLAELDTVRVGRSREQAEVARTIGELQAQVARQAQELAFYQGILEQNSTPPLGVKIQQPHISQGESVGTFRIRMALVRAGKPDDVVNGVIRLSVDGESNGTPTTLNMSELLAGGQRELPVTFRYFENLDQEIRLPSGFRPERLTVEVRSSRKGVTPLTQTFLWNVDR